MKLIKNLTISKVGLFIVLLSIGGFILAQGRLLSTSEVAAFFLIFAGGSVWGFGFGRLEEGAS